MEPIEAEKVFLKPEDIAEDDPQRELKLQAIADGKPFIVAKLPAMTLKKGDTFSLKIKE